MVTKIKLGIEVFLPIRCEALKLEYYTQGCFLEFAKSGGVHDK